MQVSMRDTPPLQVEERKVCLPPCVLALLVDVSALDLGGGWQLPTGQRRMQQPVATVVSSSPAAALGDARCLLLPRRLRRHQPQRSRSRSSSPELSHPSNCPSSGGAFAADTNQARRCRNLLLTPTAGHHPLVVWLH